MLSDGEEACLQWVFAISVYGKESDGEMVV